MTAAEEWADKICYPTPYSEPRHEDVVRAIREAVAEERAACEAIVQQNLPNWPDLETRAMWRALEAIRARGLVFLRG